MIRVFLLGNPNCGKTTIFNALTGENQRIGNWPGVTVEKKTGSFGYDNKTVEVTDLPGIYSLTAPSQSIDEMITVNTVDQHEADVWVNVIDACHLERHLYLTSQWLDYGKPMIIALNMMDLAEKQGIMIDTAALSAALGVPVLILEANRERGIEALKKAIVHTRQVPQPLPMSFPAEITPEIDAFINNAANQNQSLHQVRQYIEKETDWDIWMADARYQAVHNIVSRVQKVKNQNTTFWTGRIDRIILNRWLGLPIFIMIMYGLFYFTMQIGGGVQQKLEYVLETFFSEMLPMFLVKNGFSGVVSNLVTEGIGKGLTVTVTLIPVMACMYFFLSCLELSGYMARVAFILDRFMRRLGLPGKAFVPMIIGFGCNVPAIMAVRTLDIKQERLITVLMIPFMSCSARLAIYTAFVAVFFPSNGYNIVFSLYVIGILAAIVTGFLFRKILFNKTISPLIIEMPLYHWPLWGRLFRETGRKLGIFIYRAGCVIIPICIILGGLPKEYLIKMGQGLTPIFSPMGMTHQQWPAVLALITGVLAKEVVLGTLTGLTNQIGQGFSTLFSSSISAYAYLLFILLYMPCISTMAAIRQEFHTRWMMVSLLWSFFMAYTVAVLFFQVASIHQHWMQTNLWAISIFLGYYLFYSGAKKYYEKINIMRK